MKWEICRVPSATPVWYSAWNRPDLVNILRVVYKDERLIIESVAEWKQDDKHYVTWHYIPNFTDPVDSHFGGAVKKSKIKWSKRA